MATYRRLEKVGDGLGITLPPEAIAHLGIEEGDPIALRLEEGTVVVFPALQPGSHRESFEDALQATIEEYGPALRRLALPPDDEEERNTDG